MCLGLGGFVERPPFRRRISEVQLALFLELNAMFKVCWLFGHWSQCNRLLWLPVILLSTSSIKNSY